MAKNLVFIGAPGSGKGTQSAILKKDFGYEHISTGDLLRSEIAKESELGNRVKSIMEQGQLVSDELVVELIKANLSLETGKYIFDGYPRNIAQAQTLDNEILQGHDYTVIYFGVDVNKLVDRIINRRVSEDGKHIYNLVTNPPKVAGICDITGQPLHHRKDDKEEVIRKRMDVFADTVGPMLDFYKDKGLCVEINADQPVEAVLEQMKKNI
jgi:adenylate kinase